VDGLDHIINRRIIATGSLITRYVIQGLNRLSRRYTTYSEEHKLIKYLKYYSASMYLVK
jgi:DNA-directed RNA polymerase beta subunit